ncbi:MAG: copper chaperone PCu(A)C [Pseudomonadota bacterium]
MRRTALVFTALSCFAASLTACSEETGNDGGGAVTTSGFEVRINPAPGRPAAGYGVIKGKPGLGITGASSPEAGRVELHIMEMSGEAMRMKKVDMLLVDSDGTLAFEKGGRHLMLFDVAEDADADGAMQINFTLDNGTTLTTFADVKR